MSTTSKGDSFEKQIYTLFKTEIDNDRFWAKRDCCKIYWKKPYFSSDRQEDIIFDVAIEVFLPGSTDYSQLIIFECKNYGSPVPVKCAEEFYAKCQQISASVKGVLASTNSFQSGTREYAKSKGIGLVRYFGKTNYKWELKRSPSASARVTTAGNIYQIDNGLSQENYHSQIYDLYGETNIGLTNSLWIFLENLLNDILLDLKQAANSRNRIVSLVKFIECDEIESIVTAALDDIAYNDGEVSLEAVCHREQKRCALTVLNDRSLSDSLEAKNVLGRISFDPLQIQLFYKKPSNIGRERFTLAHELGHLLLGHGNYMNKEYCEESDFQIKPFQVIDASDIERMEWQANYFASCLLMPRNRITSDFRSVIANLDIPNRGFGALFVDNQQCNRDNYYIVTNRLKAKYYVSRSAVKIRLENLGLLTDTRMKPETRGAPSFISDEHELIGENRI